jgi:hypothetical protein
MEMWQRLDNLKISWDFADLGRVMRNNGRVFVDAPSVGDRRTVFICLTLMTSKPWFTSPSEMSSGGVLGGRCRMTATGMGLEVTDERRTGTHGVVVG